MLYHDRDTDRFVGPDFAVPNERFLAHLRCLLTHGWGMSEALDYLLDEANWSPNMPGVEPLLRADEVLAEAAAILVAARHD